MKKTSIPVIVEGKEFESISAAARMLNVSSAQVWHKAHTTGTLNGLSVCFKDKTLSKAKTLEKDYQKNYLASKKKAASNKRNCPVICETLNKKFNSIKEASKFAKVNGWTMGMKMEAKGQFVDKNGNIYKRLKPMNTKNIYKTPTDGITKEVTHHTKTTPIMESIKVDSPISILQNNAINLIKAGNYKEAGSFLNALETLSKNN